ncbi:LOW QUALITY PROTEIN: otefin [Drosophila gunungcola]|uniref:LOW QUALITY PROTEIN: otefin n=1 Tax=Drosophila gunungcola TaxID=103775 RepID=UPI0022E09C9B|nr:LOW QUALITY PROTEIN: otefin [Drosophila gunungcola]
MADVDDFDSLSNAELRTKMLAQGLPNIPVTDSSRKVLVKRLRASIGGQSSPAASPKKGGRRETLAPGPAPVASAPAAASTPVDKLDGNKVAPATKARRTITAAIAATEVKETERRRPEEPVVARKPTAVAAATAAAPPIQTRRTSTSSTGFERKVVEPVKKPKPIAEEPVASKRADREENYLKVNSLIVLESDEEEDEQLAQAADLLEQQHAAREKATSKLASSGTTTYEYKSKVSSVVEPPRRSIYEPTAAPVLLAPSGPTARSQTQTQATSSSARSYDYLNNPTGGRYSSYVRTATQGYVTAEAPPAPTYTSSNYRSTYANELSDEYEAEEDQYESTFAQNLARLRSERIGDRNSPYSRRTLASGSTGSGSLGYEPRARRSLRPDDNSVSVAFGRWWNSLEQKYHIKSKLFILFVVVLLIGVYSIFF